MNDPDNILIDHARNGDLTAATQLIQRHYARIYAYHRRQSANDHDAADLTQRTFSKAWEGLDRGDSIKDFTSWLYGIAYHIYVDWVRQSTRQSQRETRWWEIQPDESSPFHELEEQDMATHIFALVDRLEERLRQPIQLHYYQHLTLAQTAEVLGTSIGTVKNRLREGRQQLQKETAALNP